MKTETNRRGLLLIILCFVAFVSLGLPDGLLGVAWPSMRGEFGLRLDALGPLLFASTCGYMLSSFFSGIISRTLGIGRLLGVSCAATGVSLLGFTLVPGWGFLVALGILTGLGAGAIDAGLNTYVATHHSERLMQWLHASFGIGITCSPLIMTAGLRVSESWRTGYWIVGGGQLLLGIGFFMTWKLWEPRRDRGYHPARDTHSRESSGQAHEAGFRQSFGRLSVWISMGLFFLYGGIEMTLGHWAYSLLTESRGVEPAVAGLWVGFFWGTFTVGRMVAGVFANILGNHHLVMLSLGLALAGALLLAWNPVSFLGQLAVGVIGFALAPIFPGMVSGTPRRVGLPHLRNTMGMQIAAAGIGAAGLPALAGVLAARLSLEIVPVLLVGLVLVLCGLYLTSRLMVRV